MIKTSGFYLPPLRPCRKILVELVRRFAVSRRLMIISRLELHVRWDTYPLTCSQVIHRLPFEHLCHVRFSGIPVVKEGYWMFCSSFAAWDRQPVEEMADIDPAPGEFLFSTGSVGTLRNPKQRKIRLQCCLDKHEKAPPMICQDAVPFAVAVSSTDLRTFAQDVITADNSRYDHPDLPPLLMRVTAKGISPHLGSWKP